MRRDIYAYSDHFKIPVQQLDWLTEFDIIEWAAYMEIQHEARKQQQLKEKNKASRAKSPRARRKR